MANFVMLEADPPESVRPTWPEKAVMMVPEE
jgi:hypothetical protein